MNVQINYLNGDIDCFSAPAMSLEQGYIIQNDHLIINPKSLWEKGLVWERDYFTYEDTDPTKKGLHLETITILPVEQLKQVRSIDIDGNTYLVNLEGEFVFADTLTKGDKFRFIKFANTQREILNNTLNENDIEGTEINNARDNTMPTDISEEEMFIADYDDLDEENEEN